MEKIQILNYGVYIGSGLIKNLNFLLREELLFFPKVSRIAIVTDKNIAGIDACFSALDNQLSQLGLPYEFILLPPGESTKSGEHLNKIYEEFYKFGLTRGDLVIAFGGGVVGDIAGYAAATYLRGIPYIHLPTSLIAQVDSSMGGKTGINSLAGKNTIGAFYQPSAVFIDPDFLHSLPEENFIDGMAEVIKYGCIVADELLDILEECGPEVIKKYLPRLLLSCCKAKRVFVNHDEKDKGDRMLLNFGHTIGHAIEKYFDYKTYSHGQCVAMGMYTITVQSEKFGLTQVGTTERLKNILIQYNLPWQLPLGVDAEELLRLGLDDKKRLGNTLHLVILKKMGEGVRHEIQISDLGKYI